MIKLSKYAVRGFLEECYRKGYTEKQATALLVQSVTTSDALWDKEAAKKKETEDDGEWEETTKEEFFKKHPVAKQVYDTPSYRKDHKYDSFFDVLDSGKKLKVNKKNPYHFKWDPSMHKGAGADEWEETTKEQFLRTHPEALKVWHDKSKRSDPQYAAMFAALEGKNGRVLVNKKDPKSFRFHIGKGDYQP